MMRFFATILICAAMLAGCRATPEVPAASVPGERSAALTTMENVARGAQRCWFASGDPAFANYRLANELNSFSGRPRILLVPASNPEARPLLVVQAEGASPEVEIFGPLMDETTGERIDREVRRWAQGSSVCA